MSQNTIRAMTGADWDRAFGLEFQKLAMEQFDRLARLQPCTVRGGAACSQQAPARDGLWEQVAELAVKWEWPR
jgi:hypothetical protein